MELHHLFHVFFFVKSADKTTRTDKRNKTLHSSYRESYWVHHCNFFEVYLFEVLDGCLSVCSALWLTDGWCTVWSLRHSERQVLAYFFSLSFCTTLITPDILFRADTDHNSRLSVSHPDTDQPPSVCRHAQLFQHFHTDGCT